MLDRISHREERIVRGCSRNLESKNLLREMRLTLVRWSAKEEAAQLYACAMWVPPDSPLRTTAEGEAHRKRNSQLCLQLLDNCILRKLA